MQQSTQTNAKMQQYTQISTKMQHINRYITTDIQRKQTQTKQTNKYINTTHKQNATTPETNIKQYTSVRHQWLHLVKTPSPYRFWLKTHPLAVFN